MADYVTAYSKGHENWHITSEIIVVESSNTLMQGSASKFYWSPKI